MAIVATSAADVISELLQVAVVGTYAAFVFAVVLQLCLEKKLLASLLHCFGALVAVLAAVATSAAVIVAWC